MNTPKLAPPGNDSSHKLESVEALRAAAAFMIVIYHMVMLSKMVVPDGFGFIHQYFGLGVPLFYVLSGFVLSFGYMDGLDGREKITRFYIRRFFRIAPLFYTMIGVWIIASYALWGSGSISVGDIAINASMLFGLIPGKHESIVWAGWSIGVEMLFYLVFPILVVFVNTLRSGVLVLSLSIVVSSASFSALTANNMGSYAYMNLVTHLPHFIAGMLGFLIWRRTGYARSSVIGGALFLLAVSGVSAVIFYPGAHVLAARFPGVRLDHYLWSLIFMTLILALCLQPFRIFVNPVTAGLGRISFSVYLLHPLIIVLLGRFYEAAGGLFDEKITLFLACALVTTGSVCAVSLVSYRLIEIPGMRYGKSISHAT